MNIPKEKAKLSPAFVARRLRLIAERIRAANEEFRDVKSRCSHKGKVSGYIDYEDSGYICSACDTQWRRWPKGVEE